MRLGQPKMEIIVHVMEKITIDVPVVYMAQDVLILMRAYPILRAIGRGGL